RTQAPRRPPHEPRPAAVAALAAHLAPVPPRDLAHEREPQAGPDVRGGARRGPIERREDLLALGLGHAGAPIADAYHHALAARRRHGGLDRRRAVADRVLQEVAHEPAQAPPLTPDAV